MAIKCPQCGASVEDEGKFCKYCGGKLPLDEGVKRHEVKIETINHTKIRKAEIAREQAAEENEIRLEQERIRLEQLREGKKSNRNYYLLMGGVLLFCLIMYLISLQGK